MKRFLVLLFVNLVLVLLQLSFFGELFGSSFVPNLILALAFALVFSGLEDLGKMSAFLGGLLLDVLGFNIIGFSPLIIISCMIMYDFVRKNISRNFLVNALVTFGSTLIYDRLLFGGVSISSAFLTLSFAGIFYLIVSNVSGYFLRSGYKLTE